MSRKEQCKYPGRRVRERIFSLPLAELVALGALLCFGCDNSGDSDPRTDDAAVDDCIYPGEVDTCQCESGLSGIRVCLGDGTYTPCDCSTSNSGSCDEPGAEFTCTCPGGVQGTRYCLADGTYTACNCGAGAAGSGAAGSGASGSGNGAEGCPSGYQCDKLEGFDICVNRTGIPPLCKTDQQCAGEGLPDAMCIDPDLPGAGGVTVCVQTCTL